MTGTNATFAANRVNLAAFAAGFLVLALIVATSVVLSLHSADTGEEIARSQRMQTALFQVVSDVTDAETGQRGYLLTGRDVYLEPFWEAVGQMPGHLSALERDAPASDQVARLGQAVQSKAAELRRTVELARNHDLQAAMAVVQSDQGRLLMDEIRRMSDSLLDREQQRLVMLIQGINRNGRILVMVDVLGMAAVIGVAVLAGLGVRRGMRTLEAARGALRDANVQLAATNAVLAGTNAQLEERVAARTAALTDANEEIQRFAYIVSHDLRAPLVNIMGFTSELEEAVRVLGGWVAGRDDVPAEVAAAANDDLPEAIRFIRTSSGKMDRLIGAILKLSREGKRNLAQERLDMPALVGGILDTLRHQADERGATLTLEPVPGLVGDRVAVEQVFANVIENALKYAHPGRPNRIAVSGRQVGASVVYEVADTGRGIAERDRERVFELFRRAGDQTVPGEGIGLAHVRALVRRMGGDVDFRSELGAGTTFRITLPAQPVQRLDGAGDNHLEAAA